MVMAHVYRRRGPAAGDNRAPFVLLEAEHRWRADHGANGIRPEFHPLDVQLVAVHSGRTLALARRALIAADSDIVDAILLLCR